mmetsp:Transcript_23154/g.29084  ORF Transcript_23154/g.29084 Transcript_23154/m.29084 type:complete len:315 (+) Transcript_23154:1518-2462(+)
MVLFLLLAMVMALNMLIAILSDTYSRLAENRHAEWCLLFGGIVSQSQVLDQWPHNLKLPAPLSLVTHLLYPLVWLHETQGWAWPAVTATAVVFTIDMIVHLLVGLPVLLVTLISFSWDNASFSWDNDDNAPLEGAAKFIVFPFFHLCVCFGYFFVCLPSQSFDKCKSFIPPEMKQQSQYEEEGAVSNPVVHNGTEDKDADHSKDVDAGVPEKASGVQSVEEKGGDQEKDIAAEVVEEGKMEDGVEAGADAGQEKEWLTAMREALAQCQITEDNAASAQVLGEITKLATKLDTLETKLETMEGAIGDIKDLLMKR